MFSHACVCESFCPQEGSDFPALSASRGCLSFPGGGGGTLPYGSGRFSIQGQEANSPIGYYGIQSSSGRYASHWNATCCSVVSDKYVITRTTDR